MSWVQLAHEELSRLDGSSHAAKRKATIIALVDAHLAQRSEETVWDRDDTCARNTYHSKWKKDPLFAEVLERVDALAREWQDKRALHALQEAAEALALASPDAVRSLVAMMGQTEDLTNARLSATAILDRAGVETAAKSSSEMTSRLTVSGDAFAELMRQAEEDAEALEDDILNDGWESDSVPGG